MPSSWDISGEGVFWKVQLDVRDLGGHLDFTLRLGLVLFPAGFVKLLLELLQLVLYLWGLVSGLGWLVESIFLLASMLQRLLLYPLRLLVPFRAAIVRAIWSSEMPLSNALAILNLLDGPVGVGPAFFIVWSRFRMMRRYLASCPEEEPRIFRMLDLISTVPRVTDRVHLLLTSAAELGFCLGW